MRVSSRRQFIWMTMGTGFSLGFGLTACLRNVRTAAEGDRAAVASELQVVRRTDWALGSEVTITALHHDARVAGNAISAALTELRFVESLMSIYQPDSQLARLNRNGRLEHPHPYLVAVLREAIAMSQRSGGAFDITVQPLWALYHLAWQADRQPEAAALRAALEVIDWRRVELTARRIEFRGAGTAVTLNGIAQGFAADRLMATLRRHGVEHALVNTGEIALQGTRADGQPWTVGIQHPRNNDAYVSLAALEGRCLATSGDYATTFSKDFRSNHLFDPRTGRSPKRFASVSIVAPTATLADAMSTAVFVLGPEKGLDLVRSTPHADALFVFKDGRTMATEGFPRAT